MADIDKDPENLSRLPLRSLGLKPGMALQTRRIAAGAKKIEAQYFGGIEGKGVMIGPLGPEGLQTELAVGEVCVVRGFTGQYEYSFLTKVLQTFEKPFIYALMVYPAQVDARLVRRSMRVQSSWPTRLVDARNATKDVTLVDLSTGGAMVKSIGQLAEIGDKVQIKLSVQVEGADIELTLAATVCHNNRASYEEAYFLGVAFRQLSPQDKLVLNCITQTS